MANRGAVLDAGLPPRLYPVNSCQFMKFSNRNNQGFKQHIIEDFRGKPRRPELLQIRGNVLHVRIGLNGHKLPFNPDR